MPKFAIAIAIAFVGILALLIYSFNRREEGAGISSSKVHRSERKMPISRDPVPKQRTTFSERRVSENATEVDIVPEKANQIRKIFRQLIKSEDERATLVEVKKSKVSQKTRHIYLLKPISEGERNRLLNLANSAVGLRDDGHGTVIPWSQYFENSFGLNLSDDVNIELSFSPDNEYIASALTGVHSNSNKRFRYSEAPMFASSAYQTGKWRFSHLMDFELVDEPE